MSIIQYPHPILRKRIEYDPKLNDDWVIERLTSEIKYYQEESGAELIGIAANQIGIETRICLFLDIKGVFQPLINPEIIRYLPDEQWQTPWIEIEECASLPNYSAEIQRARHITLSLDKYSFKTEAFEGWEARIIQHEVDHLNGVLLIDYED